MNDLRKFVVLQARLYEFLEQQDDSTLEALTRGTAKLGVVRVEASAVPVSSPPREDVHAGPAPAPPVLAASPSGSPLQVAHEMSSLASEQQRRIYLNASALRVKELREVARILGLTGYSALKRAELVDLLARCGPGRADVRGNEMASTRVSRTSAEPAKTDEEAAAIASHLRQLDTEEEGTAYLRAQDLDRESLLAVAGHLQLTRVERLSQAELEKRVLKQAIAARRKFAGLRRW